MERRILISSTMNALKYKVVKLNSALYSVFFTLPLLSFRTEPPASEFIKKKRISGFFFFFSFPARVKQARIFFG